MKNRPNTLGERGKIRVRFFEIEMEGGSDALQDSVKALTAALSKPVAPARLQLQGAQRADPVLLESVSEDPSDEEDLPDVEDRDTQPTMKAPRQRARRTPPTPKVLDDCGFGDGDPTWAKFAADKKPSTDVSRVAVVAAWFKRVKEVNTIDINHAYTAFKFVDWPTPDDIGQCFRNAKRQSNWFGTDGEGNWTINIIGLNAVDKLKAGE